MPIDIETFETADEEFFWESDDSVAQEVFEFLAYNPNQAYTRQEIQSVLELRTFELLSALSSLELEGRIRHRGPYWAVAEGYERPEDHPPNQPA